MKDQLDVRVFTTNRSIWRRTEWLNGSSSNITQNREFMDWVDRPQGFVWNFATFARLLFLDNISLKALKLGWVAFHSLKFQLKVLDFQSNQYKKLAPVLSKLYKFGWHTSASNARMKNSKDLILGEVLVRQKHGGLFEHISGIFPES